MIRTVYCVAGFLRGVCISRLRFIRHFCVTIFMLEWGKTNPQFFWTWWVLSCSDITTAPEEEWWSTVLHIHWYCLLIIISLLLLHLPFESRDKIKERYTCTVYMHNHFRIDMYDESDTVEFRIILEKQQRDSKNNHPHNACTVFILCLVSLVSLI